MLNLDETMPAVSRNDEHVGNRRCSTFDPPFHYIASMNDQFHETRPESYNEVVSASFSIQQFTVARDSKYGDEVSLDRSILLMSE